LDEYEEIVEEVTVKVTLRFSRGTRLWEFYEKVKQKAKEEWIPLGEAFMEVLNETLFKMEEMEKEIVVLRARLEEECGIKDP